MRPEWFPITDYGSVEGDPDVERDTAAYWRAVKAADEAGGGTIYLHAGAIIDGSLPHD